MQLLVQFRSLIKFRRQAFRIHSWPWTSVRLLGRWNVSLEWLHDSWDLWLSSSYSSKLCYHPLIPAGFNTGKGSGSRGCLCFIGGMVCRRLCDHPQRSTYHSLTFLVTFCNNLFCAFSPYATYASLLQPYIFLSMREECFDPSSSINMTWFYPRPVWYHADKRATCTVYSQLYTCILLTGK